MKLNRQDAYNLGAIFLVCLGIAVYQTFFPCMPSIKPGLAGLVGWGKHMVNGTPYFMMFVFVVIAMIYISDKRNAR